MADKKAAKTEDKEVKKTKKKAEVVAESAPVEADVKPEIEVEAVKATAKAGKRSAKAQREVAAEEAKQTRKQTSASTETTVKPTKKPTRPKAERAGKKYRQSYVMIDKAKLYSVAEAMALAAQTSPTKFDATVELHVNLEVDPKLADQNIRDTLSLPAGSGKAVRIAVFAEADDAKAAQAAGADIAGIDELIALLDKEDLGFDILIATPALMPRLGKYARLLGPRGLMPNPKSGTVSNDVVKAVKEARAGRVEYRTDSAGIIHLGIGKVSFGADKLQQNAEAVLASIKNNRPASIKGTYIKSAYVATTMGPSVKLSLD